MIEVGIPFSDPVMDGPTIQQASQRALAAGATPEGIIASLGRLDAGVPVAVMTYYNLILRYGLGAFCRDAVGAGLDGLIVADLPPEEGTDLVAAAQTADLATVFLLAPTSTEGRIRAVAAASTGFVYCVSRTGVTGVRDELPAGLRDLILRIREQTQTPICVGFGLSRPEQVREVAAVADGVIVGSALVQMIEEAPDALDRVGTFVRGLRSAIDDHPR